MKYASAIRQVDGFRGYNRPQNRREPGEDGSEHTKHYKAQVFPELQGQKRIYTPGSKLLYVNLEVHETAYHGKIMPQKLTLNGTEDR
jgi:hypothetical protein